MNEPRIPNPEEQLALAEELRRLAYERALEYLRTHQLPDWTPADGLFGIRDSDED